MISTRNVTASMTVDEGYIDTPAHDVQVFAQGFESGLAGDTLTGAASISTDYAHSGTHSLKAVNAGGSAGIYPSKAFATTVGKTYTRSMWAYVPASSTATSITLHVVGGPFYSVTTLPRDQWFKIQAPSWVAAAVSTQLYYFTDGTAYFDDVLVVENVPAHTGYSLPLIVLDGTAKLDEGWAPYGQLDIEVAFPEPDSFIDLVDPRLHRRVKLTTTETVEGVTSSYNYDLSLRERVLDHNNKTIALTLATDEALLQDFTYVATTPDKTPLQYQGSLRALINAKILAPIGAALEPTWQITRTNYLPNPTAAVDASSYSNGGSASTISRDTVEYFSGGSSIKVVTTGAGAGVIARVADTRGWVGKPLAAAFMFKGPSGTSFSADVRLGPTVGALMTFTATGSWQRIDVPSIVGVSGTLPFFYVRGGPAGTTFWIDDAQIEEATFVGSLFNGSMVNTSVAQYAWTGTANASLSTMATLTPGMTDADVTTLAPAQNLILNGSAEATAAEWASGGGCTIARTTVQAYKSTASIAATMTTTSGAVFATNTTTYLPASPDKIYTATAWMRAGTAGVSATITIRFLTSANATIANYTSTSSTMNSIVWKQWSITAPAAPATTARIAVYVSFTGTASGQVQYIDGVTLMEGNGLETDGVNFIDYFDGNTPDTALYNYTWDGVAYASSSTRTPVFSRDPDTLILQPGDNLYEWITPVNDTAGLRLFCDEQRKWRLVDPSWSVPSRLSLAGAVPLDNVYSASDTISKTATDDAGQILSFEAVIVKYSWNDANNVAQTAYDTAGPSGVVTKVVEFNRPYLGPGMASYILSRAQGKGRTLDITARRDFSARPGMEVTASLPNTPIQSGRVGSVEWSFGSDDMTVGTKGLTDTPAAAWMFLAPGVSWNASPAGQSWVSETV